MKVIAVFTETGSPRDSFPNTGRGARSSPSPLFRKRAAGLALLLGRGAANASARSKDIEELVQPTEKRLLEENLVQHGDVVGIVAGTPLGVGGTTNFMKFHVIGSDEEKIRRASQ